MRAVARHRMPVFDKLEMDGGEPYSPTVILGSSDTRGYRSYVSAGFAQLNHHHLRADLHAPIKVDHVLVAHADAPRGDGRADGPGLVRSVDAIERRAEIHGARAERIFRAAGHV